MSLTVANNSEARYPRHDGHTGKAMWSLYGHDDEVMSACVHKNLFATSSVDGVSLVWQAPADEKDPANVCCLTSGGPAVLDACFVDDRRLATAQGDATVSLWDIETGKRMASLSRLKVPGRSSWPVINAVAMANVETICFGGDDGYLAFADTRSPGVVASINRKSPVTALRAVDVALFAGDACGHLCGFDQRGSWRAFMDVKCARDAVSGVACAAKGDQAAVVTMDGKLSLVDTQPFAVQQQDRLLATVDLPHDEERTLKRGQWSDALDTIVFPTTAGAIGCVAPSRFSAGVTRSFKAAEGGEANFATILQDRFVLYGGSASVSLAEW